jgi:hypothetical protein
MASASATRRAPTVPLPRPSPSPAPPHSPPHPSHPHLKPQAASRKPQAFKPSSLEPLASPSPPHQPTPPHTNPPQATLDAEDQKRRSERMRHSGGVGAGSSSRPPSGSKGQHRSGDSGSSGGTRYVVPPTPNHSKGAPSPRGGREQVAVIAVPPTMTSIVNMWTVRAAPGRASPLRDLAPRDLALRDLALRDLAPRPSPLAPRPSPLAPTCPPAPNPNPSLFRCATCSRTTCS